MKKERNLSNSGGQTGQLTCHSTSANVSKYSVASKPNQGGLKNKRIPMPS